MKMIKAIVRPERCPDVLDILCENGYRAATRYSILGRGKQKGLKVGDVYYDEIPKEMIMLFVQDKDEERIINLISQASRASEDGSFGDGKIIVVPIEKSITISSGELDEG